MKGFSGILILFTFLIVSIILLSTTYQQKSEDNTLTVIPKIKNAFMIYEINIKNMAQDCNWLAQEMDVNACLFEGSNVIFEKTKLDQLISCQRPTLQKIDTNNYYLDLNCTNSVILQRNTNFTVQKRVVITSSVQ